jgi:hypothetical protein
LTWIDIASVGRGLRSFSTTPTLPVLQLALSVRLISHRGGSHQFRVIRRSVAGD